MGVKKFNLLMGDLSSGAPMLQRCETTIIGVALLDEITNLQVLCESQRR